MIIKTTVVLQFQLPCYLKPLKSEKIKIEHSLKKQKGESGLCMKKTLY
uniref:Uncharacterized protein n=1 Tax=Anguilla anguilla TaxID=7936 RepID=A0A0E9X9E3_ANGAN